jgi:hypothetical protein
MYTISYVFSGVTRLILAWNTWSFWRSNNTPSPALSEHVRAARRFAISHFHAKT